MDSANLYAFNRFDSVNFIDPLGASAGESLTDENNHGAQDDAGSCRDGATAATGGNLFGTVCGVSVTARGDPFVRAKKEMDAQARENKAAAPRPVSQSPSAVDAVTEKVNDVLIPYMLGATAGVMQAVTPGAAFVPLPPSGNRAYNFGKNLGLLAAGLAMMLGGGAGAAGGTAGTAVPVVGQMAGPAAVYASAVVTIQGASAAAQGAAGLAAMMASNGNGTGPAQPSSSREPSTDATKPDLPSDPAAGGGGPGTPPGNPDGQKGTFYVDPKGNVVPTPPGGSITGSPDGRFIQARDAAGNPTGVRIDGPHRPATHPDPRAQQPHGHVPGVTNPDGTPWLPVK